MKNPCSKNCPGRSPTCHCECEEYLAFFEERQRLNKERQILNGINNDNAFIDRRVKCAIKAKARRY
jgi:hypothetical protein